MHRYTVEWTYTHHLNSVSKVRRTKTGLYYRKVRHKSGYHGPQLAVVRFDGNKNQSKVPYYQLVFLYKGECDPYE